MKWWTIYKPDHSKPEIFDTKEEAEARLEELNGKGDIWECSYGEEETK